MITVLLCLQDVQPFNLCLLRYASFYWAFVFISFWKTYSPVKIIPNKCYITRDFNFSPTKCMIYLYFLECRDLHLHSCIVLFLSQWQKFTIWWIGCIEINDT